MHLLVIDDEPLIIESIKAAFPEDEVYGFTTAQEGINHFLHKQPEVVLCDIRLPDMSGLEAFDKFHRIDPHVPIVIMTGNGTSGTAIEAMQRGAFEYVLKPLDPDTLIPTIESAAATCRMTRVPAVLPDSADFVGQDDSGVDMIVGNCPAMQEVYRSIGRVAKQHVTVLILGESGTGKEVIARALYQYSARPDGRFLAINCAAIPEPLLESELFGYEKGAFTGAETKRIGKFELCNTGTLFLDEIGDMTPLMQTKILRVLQDQSFERVGGSQTIHTDARIIAATNRNLQQAIEKKEFRSDLFYRLNVYTIQLPPLRERGADIMLLANHFARRFAAELKKEFLTFSTEVANIFQNYAWPGNVRELQSVVKRSLLQATGPVIVPAFLPPLHDARQSGALVNGNEQASVALDSRPRDEDELLNFRALTRAAIATGSDDIYREMISCVEKEIFAEILLHTQGNLSQAAKRLGITRSTLRSKLASLGFTIERSPELRPVNDPLINR